MEKAFLDSFGRMESVTAEPRRNQDRFEETKNKITVAPSPQPPEAFCNVADTDWSLPQNSDWAVGIVESWQNRCDEHAAEVPLVIGGEEIAEGRERKESNDPSRPEKVVANYWQAVEGDVERAVACARQDAAGWRGMPIDGRREILFSVADEIAGKRGELMGAMLAEGGKTLAESDPEVSEAIDFCRFYARSAEAFFSLPGLESSGRGTVVVVSPWNFPLAIPCGGIAAALAAGNTVIFKPASDTVLIGYLLCECFWEAGVPKSTLQFMPCRGGTVGQQLVSHDGVDTVILTGGTETALRMLAAKPDMHLLAETGGKNATIVTALADRDLAIKNVLHSAFSHSGQKCSATSLLVLEEEVYNDPKFRESLCDAVESLHVDSAWQLHTKMGPLIRPPSGDLERALKELEPGESWAVMPRLHVNGNPHLVSPGVKWGVQPNSVTHCTEFFGPLLGVMRARDLHEAIDLVNATGYGLTSGLESLDDREQKLWQEGIRAGNLYINRPTTGAIVLRQPFGGMGKSAIGPGIKAGGPNYVAPLMKFATNGDYVDRRADLGDTPLDDFCDSLRKIALQYHVDVEQVDKIVTAAQSYEHWMGAEFDHAHDSFRLLGEDNFRRYLPLRELLIRVHADDSLFEIFARALAARTAGCQVVVSLPEGFESAAVQLLEELTHDWAGGIEFVEQADSQLVELIESGHDVRLRYADPGRVSDSVRSVAASQGAYVADVPVSAHGRVELLWYFQEQSLTHVYHRYGNLGVRGCEI